MSVGNMNVEVLEKDTAFCAPNASTDERTLTQHRSGDGVSVVKI